MRIKINYVYYTKNFKIKRIMIYYEVLVRVALIAIINENGFNNKQMIIV